MQSAKEAFADEMANIQENMDDSTSELVQDKQKAKDRVKDKTDIPIIDTFLNSGSEDKRE